MMAIVILCDMKESLFVSFWHEMFIWLLFRSPLSHEVEIFGTVVRSSRLIAVFSRLSVLRKCLFDDFSLVLVARWINVCVCSVHLHLFVRLSLPLCFILSSTSTYCDISLLFLLICVDLLHRTPTKYVIFNKES